MMASSAQNVQITSPGSGGGSPTSSSNTPPAAPSLKVGSSTVLTAEFSTQTPTPYCSFSPKTCLELLSDLTPEQIDFEYEYFKSEIYNFEASRTRNPPTDTKIKCIRSKIDNDVTKLVTDSIHNIEYYNKLTSNFSYLLEEAKCFIEEVKTVPTQDPPTPLSDGMLNLPEAVCLLDFKLNVDFNATDITDSDISFREIGSRKVAYFGGIDYSYDKVTHTACPYPDNAALNSIIDQLSSKIEDFSRDTYTCLITLYDDNKTSIPFHSDNELSIQEDSSIYTVSLGETRTLKFRNIIGLVTPKSYNISNGMVYAMTRDSQLYWEHSIPPTHVNCGPRVSLTFRKLIQCSNYQSSNSHHTPQVPPIHKPITTHNHNTPTPTRILLLTDSIHSTFPTHMFPEPLVCIKKLDFKLTNIINFEHEFNYTDFVIFSSGINDLSRYDHTSQSLIHEMRGLFETFCVKYPKTTFIFNSILRTKFDWLNVEVDDFNKEIFEMSLSPRCENLWYFDSHHILTQINNRVRVFLPNGNGIHITFAAKKHVSWSLVQCIKLLAKSRPVSGQWPLRPCFLRYL